MAIQTRALLKSWFLRGLKPLASQFADWLDSFWHKSESIPIGSIEGLTDILNTLSTIPLAGTWANCGFWDASGGHFPADVDHRGTGPAGAVLSGNAFKISGAGILAGVDVEVGATILATANSPGDDLTKWTIFN